MSAASSANGRAERGEAAGRSRGARGKDTRGTQPPGLSTNPGSWQGDASVRDRDDLPKRTTRCLLADSVGQELLAQIAGDLLELVGSAVTIGERSGECVVSVFGSPWCEFMNEVSRRCGGDGCVQLCCREATNMCVRTGGPGDVECCGGMHVYTVPILAGGEIVGSVGFGYGDVPAGRDELGRIAKRYGVKVDLLEAKARACDPRRQLTIDVAKRQLATWAKLIGGIVDRKLAAESLREREALSSSLLKSCPNPILVIDPDGSIRYVNRAFETLTGFSAAEVVGTRPPYPWWTDDALEKNGEPFGMAVRGGMSRAEVPYQKKDSERLWVEVMAVPVLREGRVRYCLVNWVDITERKRNEQAIRRSREQLRALAGHLQDVREEERTRLARKIHDDVGHALACLKMDVSRLEKDWGDSAAAESRERMKAMSEMLDTTMESVRQTASELRPGILDDVGLAAALEWQAKEFAERTGIKCTFVGAVEPGVVDRGQSTALYRICQQILTNVVLHSGADAVKVSLTEHAGSLLLEVRDNGRGISAESVSSSASIGIVGMRERALLLNGALSISGIRGEGTTVTVRIPLGEDEVPGEAAP